MLLDKSSFENISSFLQLYALMRKDAAMFSLALCFALFVQSSIGLLSEILELNLFCEAALPSIRPTVLFSCL